MKRARAAAAVIAVLSAIPAAYADDIVRYPLGTPFPIEIGRAHV